VAILAIVICDQLTKIWAVSALSDQPPLHVIGSALMFTLVYNEGGAMGTQFGSTTYYTIMAILILPFLGYYLWRYRTEWATAWPLACILGGAIGNLIDRIRLGRVVDFIDVDIPDIHLPFYDLDRFWTFNIADSAITCAIVFMLLHMLFAKKLAKPGSLETSASPTVD
jgi:signal peptidase II